MNDKTAMFLGLCLAFILVGVANVGNVMQQQQIDALETYHDNGD